MPQLILFMFDDHNRLRDKRKRVSRHGITQAQNEVLELNHLFDFYAFDKDTDLDKVTNTYSVVATHLDPAVVKEQIGKLLEPTNQNQRLGYALMPKIEARWLEMGVGVFCPCITELTESTVEERISLIKTKVGEAQQQCCRILVGPESMLHKGSGKEKSPFDQSEKNILDKELAALTKDKLLLLIPGSVFWKDDQGGVHNSMPAFANGRKLGEYDKKNWMGTELNEAQKFGKPVVGGVSYGVYDWEGWSVACQICQDSADALIMKPDFHIVSGLNTGHVTGHQREGGVFIYSDGFGLGRIKDSVRTEELGKGSIWNITDLNLAFPTKTI